MRASPLTFAGPKRHCDPGIAFDALPKIDVVLVSHGHYDHLDIATLSRLAAKFSPRVITPLGNDITMRDADEAIKAEAFDWKDRVELGNGRGRVAPDKLGRQIAQPPSAGGAQHGVHVGGRDSRAAEGQQLLEQRLAVAHRAVGPPRQDRQRVGLGTGAFGGDDLRQPLDD